MEKERPGINAAPERSEGRGAGRRFWKLGAFMLALAGLVVFSALLIGADFGNPRAGDEAPARKASARPATQPGLPAESGECGTTPKEADAAEVWLESFDAALAEAADKKVPVLVRFTASWCNPCRMMDARVWPDARVKAAIAERAVPLLIDIDEDANAEVLRRYGVRGVPTLLLVSANGDELARGGFMSAEKVVAFLRKHRSHDIHAAP